jgi:hypothetical protein
MRKILFTLLSFSLLFLFGFYGGVSFNQPNEDATFNSVSTGSPNSTEGVEAGVIEGKIENDASEEIVGGSITLDLTDETDGTEDTTLRLYNMTGGSLTEVLSFVGIDNEAISTTFWKTRQQEVIKTTTGSLTAAECSKALINNQGQAAEMTLTLPTAAKGLKFTYILGTAAQTSHIKAGVSDKIYLDGTALDDGDKVSNNAGSSVIADQIVFYTFQTGSGAYDWIAQTVQGTWTDGGA